MSKVTKKGDQKVQEKVEEKPEQHNSSQQQDDLQLQATKIEQEGFGRFEYPNGIIYEGSWKLINGQKMKHGEGTLTLTGTTSSEGGNEEYKGEWQEDKMEGYGVYRYTSGAIYYGLWKNNKHNGKGTYEFPDGTLYEGEFKDHKMHGEGYYIDKLGNKWEGEFVNGIYQSKMQKELKQAKIMNKKEEEISAKAKTFFEKFAEAFAKSDKKTMKDNLLPFFSVQDEIKLYIKDPYPKYEEKAPEKWNDALKWLSEYTFSNVLRHQSNSKIIDSANILAPQFQGNGQVVEYMRETEARTAKLAICNQSDGSWTIIFYHDTEVEVKGKK